MTGMRGIDEVVRALGKLPISMEKVSKAALRAGAGPVKKQASANFKALVSKEATGLAERSISIYSLKRFQGKLRVAVAVTRGAISALGARVGLYASVFEFGKEGQPPRPWLRPAAQQSTGSALTATKDYYTAKLDSAVNEAKQ